MVEPTDVRAGVQPALFELTRSDTDPPEALARWVYPCGLYGTVEVTDDGGICSACTPKAVRKPNRTRRTAKKTAARSSRAKPDRTSTKPIRPAGGKAGGSR